MELRDKIKELIKDKLDGYTYKEAKAWFNNPRNHNPQNGSIGGLFYYSDTEPLAIEYHDEIVKLMNDCGYDKPLSLNDMAWFAFEVLLPELENEILEELYKKEVKK